MTDRLDDIKARAEAATPGPWEFDGHVHSEKGCRCFSHLVVTGYTLTNPFPCCDETAEAKGASDDCTSTVVTFEDATFITHARQDIPYLLAEVERLTEESNGWKANYLAAVEVGKDWTADRQYAKAEIERLREELDDATGGFLTATPTAIERITSLKAEVERLRAALEGDDFIARCADALHGHRCDQAVGHSLPHRAEFGTDIYRWQPIEDETPEGGEL